MSGSAQQALADDESLVLSNTFFEELAAAEKVPVATISACLADFDAVAPSLRDLLSRAANEEVLSEAEEQVLFWGVHILALGRDRSCFKPMLKLLSRAEEDLDNLFGDALNETLPSAVVNMFDDDSAALFDLLAKRDISGFVKWNLFDALAFLTFEGKVEKDRTEAFLIRFDAESLADEEDYAWVGWQDAISLLGLRSLAERVERRSHQDLLIDFFGEGPKAFYEDLEAAEQAAPDDMSRFKKCHIGYLDDIGEALSWMNFGTREDEDIYPEVSNRPSAEPLLNPWRNVGRNDPCPCGSGKKYKKCCLS